MVRPVAERATVSSSRRCRATGCSPRGSRSIPAGTQQSWFLGVGSVSGNTATIGAVDQPTGGRFFPNFDPSKIVNNAWGTLTLTFTDCDHGKVDFASTAGYGSGSMNLTRLTRPAGVTCP